MSDIENPKNDTFQPDDASEFELGYSNSEENSYNSDFDDRDRTSSSIESETFVVQSSYDVEPQASSPYDREDITTWFINGLSGFRVPLRDVLTFGILLAILVAGYALRSEGRSWDDYTHLHPDERFLTQVAEKIHSPRSPLAFSNRPWATPADQREICIDRNPPPSAEELAEMSPQERIEAEINAGEGGYFDSGCSDLNPDNTNETEFVYGQFPLFSVRTFGEIYQDLTTNKDDELAVTPPWTGYSGIHLVGRTMSAIFDTLAILIVFLIGSRLFNRWTGLLAGTFYAFAAFPIQQSHFWTADAFTAFWVVLAIYFAVRVLDDANQYPDRVVPLPWIVIALVVWLWDLQANATVPLESVFVYLGVFGAVGIITSLAVEQKRIPVALTSGVVGIVVFLVFANIDLTYSKVFAYNQTDKVALISLPGALGGSIGLLSMIIFWSNGWNKQGVYAGTFPWLAGAYGLWIFDGLAHYDSPSLIPLIVYLILFTGAALLSSALRRADSIVKQQQLLLFTGLPLVGWGMLAVVVGEVSVWGMLSAGILVLLLGASNYWALLDYTAFGLAFGAAVAGRINVLPLVGVLFLAMLLRSLFLMDWRVYNFERNRHLNHVIFGLILAGVASLVAFRFLQPHAFKGPHIYNISLSKFWLADINKAQFLVSGDAESPPNWQWTNRVPYLFPMQNIVLWGLGLPLGIISWCGFFASLVVIGLGKRQWTRLAIPSAWILVYFGYLGRNWVTTMRYFMPIYGMLAIFAAWAIVEILKWSFRSWRMPNLNPRWRYSTVGAVLLFLVVTGHAIVYGIGSNSIHTTQLTRVALSRYMQEFVPGDIGLYIDQPDGNTRMVNLAIRFGETSPKILPLDDGDIERIQLNPQVSVNLNSLVVHRIGDPNQDEEQEEIRLRIWSVDPDNGEILLGEQLLATDFAAGNGKYGGQYTVTFENPILLSMDTAVGLQPQYFLELEVISGGSITLSRNVSDVFLPANASHITLFETSILDEAPRIEELNFETPNVHDHIAYFSPGSQSNYPFTANATGEINAVILPHVSDPFGDADPETVSVKLCEEAFDEDLQISYCVREVLGEATGDFNTADDGHLLYGPSVTLQLEEPFAVEAGQSYQLTLGTNDLLGIGGSAVAHEGPWDDPMPTPVCPVPIGMTYSKDLPSGLCRLDTASINLYDAYYIGIEMVQAREDDEEKRRVILDTLNQADFLTISSNRFYDSFVRIPTRWPMSNDYYEALFSGELGFELVETFTSYATIGPIEWKDQVLPSDDLPDWLNEFEAEEAYHVYTHPTTFLFHKTPEYSPERAAEILDVNLRRVENVSGDFFGVDIQPVNIITWPSKEASQSPTAFQFTEEQEAIQREGGTWSKLFNRDAFYNQNQVLSVVVWWIMMIAVGWLVFPLLFYILPGLPDRGFGVSKLVAWLLVAWVAWFASSLQIQLWNRNGLIGLLLTLILFSQWLGYRRRLELLTFIKQRWKHLLVVEGIATLLFIFFIGVRLGNPDLWHSSFGGEKPMNMAYFNGVLRSSIFPAIDPWFSGGYINYYYWGYVLVGTPTKILGITPSIAYNLIIPTLFSMTGMGAFSVAYNLVEWTRERRLEAVKDEIQIEETTPPRKREHFGPIANPYLAGIAALALAVILGNLDTPRIFVNNVADLGEQARTQQAIEEFRADFEREPTVEEQQILIQDVNGNSQIGSITSWLSSFGKGFSEVASGDQPLSIPSFHWHWKPTRIINELTNDAGQNIGWNAINEMPYFTFLYGDLHAHMMAMPLTLLVILFLTAEILGAGRKIRSSLGAILALFILAMTVGLLRPTNTWDWPTYMILGIVGLTFAAWVGQGRLRGHLPRMSLYQRFERALDLRYVFSLWFLLFALPIGVVIRGILHVFQKQSYSSKIEIGDIPLHCLEIDPRIVDQIPPSCEGNLEPILTISSALMWGIMAFAVVIFIYIIGLVLLGNRFDRRGIMRWAGTLVGFIGISIFAISPYNYWFATPYSKVIPWENDKTPLWAYIDIHGIFLFIIFSLLFWQTIRWLKAHHVDQLRGFGVPVLAAVVLIPTTFIATLALQLGWVGSSAFPSFLVAFPLLIWLMVLFLLPDQSHVERWVYVLAGLAIGLTMGVEMFVLEGDNARQNTVFKFYIQAWLLFSIAGGIAIAWLVRAAERWNPKLAGLWQATMAILLSIALLYPLTATQGRFKDRFNEAETPLTLDGLEFMLYAPHGEDADGNGSKRGVWFNLSGDYHMIRWLQDHVEGTPTIIEGQHTEYSLSSRISIHTGLPTLLGWRFHQSQQRNLERLSGYLFSRQQNTRAFYTTTDIGAAWNLIEFYDIEYIVVGTFERIIYEDIVRGDDPLLGDRSVQIGMSPGFAKFEVMASEDLGLLEKVYERQVCVHSDIRDVENCPPENISTDYIYRVNPDATYSTNSVAEVSP